MRYAPFALLMICISAACDQPAVIELTADIPNPSFDVITESTEYKLHLVGQGTLRNDRGETGDPPPDVIINALQKFSGVVSGDIFVPFSLCSGEPPISAHVATVVELVPPSDGGPDYWCVGAELDDVPGAIALVYVLDAGDGRTSFDDIAIEADLGVSCVTRPAPIEGFTSWDVATGDFKGSVHAK